MSSPANFNGLRPVIDVNDSVMLLIDHKARRIIQDRFATYSR